MGFQSFRLVLWTKLVSIVMQCFSAMKTYLVFSVGCKQNSVRLQPLGPCPQTLYEYLSESSPMTGKFRQNIRSVNSLFAMATFKAQIPQEVNPVGVSGHWCFTICGQIYHHCQPLPLQQHGFLPTTSTAAGDPANDDADHRRFESETAPAVAGPAGGVTNVSEPIHMGAQYYFSDVDDAVSRRKNFLGDRVD